MSMAISMATDEIEEVKLHGFVDLKGRPVERATTGGWRACYLIIGYDFCERLAYAGIWVNLVVYLTTKLHQGTVASSNNVNNWVGVSWLTPLLGAYIADTHWGRFWTFIVFSLIYIVAMVMMTLSVSLKSLRPPECPSNEGCQKASHLQIGMFFFALYLLALGAGGTRSTISTFGADQFDDFHPKEKMQKMSFFNWWMFALFFGSVIGQVFLVYIQDNIGWGVGYGIITILVVISYIVFLIGIPKYRHKRRSGSPLQRMGKVIIKTVYNWKVEVPSDPSMLHEVDSMLYAGQGRYPMAPTKHLRFLEKAAVKSSRSSNPCTVTDVEETKLVIRLLPVWLTCIFPGTLLSQSTTLFIKQAMTLDRHIGSNFKFPVASIAAFLPTTMMITVAVYDRLLMPICRRFTGNPRGITMLQRMGAGMVIYSISMVAAVVTEIRRLEVIKEHGLADNGNAIVPRTIFILLPQFILMGVAEAFIDVGRIEFFYDQVPESMQSMGTALYCATVGIGAFLGSVFLTVVSDVTGRKGHKGWVLDNLNASRLEYYYALLAAVSFSNYVAFLIISCFYTYKRELGENLFRDSGRIHDTVEE